MSNEPESDRELYGDEFRKFWGSMVLVTMRPRPSRQVRLTAVKTMFQVTQIVRLLPERGLRSRNLGFCGHDLM